MSSQKRNLTKKSNKERKPDMNEITHEEEKVALILGMASIFTVWWLFK